MSKATTKTIVPKLRFPEFRDAGEWEEASLVKLAKFRRGSFPQPYGLPEWYDDENGMPFVQVYDVSDNLKLKLTTKRKISKLAAEQSVFIPKETLIVTLQGSIGRVAVTQYDAYIDRTLLLFEKFHKPTEKLFFAYVIQNLFEIEKKKAPGGIIKTITKEVLSNFIVKLPHFLEQQKIADCLSSIDELITAHSQKHEALKAHKKGLMQQLFPAQGDDCMDAGGRATQDAKAGTTPKLRFPEFRNTEEWKSLAVGTKVDFLSGYSFKGIEMSKKCCGTRLLRGINITEGKIRHSKNIDRYYLGKANELEKYSLKEGDLVISMDGSKVGKNVALVTPLDVNALLVQRVARLRASYPHLIQFIFQHIHSTKFHVYVDRVNTSSGIPHISAKQINDFQIYFPLTAEQKKIAECLSSIDNLITAQAQKIESLKAHKKGLMQQLFPAADEVNG